MGSDDDHVCGADTETTDEPCQFPVPSPDGRCPNHPASSSSGRGRPPHEPTDFTRGLVEGLKLGGKSNTEIADRLGIHRETLRKHYGDVLDMARPAADAQVFQTAFQMATSGNSPAMTQFWIQMLADWSPDDEDGDGGGDIIVDPSIDS